MTVEYVLILSLFVLTIMSIMTSRPQMAFKDYAPMLGARIEKQLVTGEDFSNGGSINVIWTDE